ncbi:hypothetical protein MKZ38_000133 [Zalerion maritima]|uniref:Mitochondrial pyruvate carrier n=1 Tax=Zalerion maritima TaxID=339359 RepID=A0AAD5RTI7_9PEZI|nr:hypothetical protein MKZ38_000133 [Zalerion maritima]
MPPTTSATVALRTTTMRSSFFYRPFQARSAAFNHKPFARRSGGRFRMYSSEAPAAEQQQGWIKRMWESPIGFQTVHFCVLGLIAKLWVICAGEGEGYVLRQRGLVNPDIADWRGMGTEGGKERSEVDITADGGRERNWKRENGVEALWAPVMKWAIVIAGITDFFRPVEKLSVAQNLSLTATGLIWTRWCLIIKPKNYLLAAVNFFLGIVGIVQVTRIGIHNFTKKDAEPLAAAIKEEAEQAKEEVKEAVEKV